MIGTKLAHYEITSHLGTGGMGEVYQASDSKLGRSVAIKLLPEAFTHDVDRAARFEREARVLASLNHSNIAAIYGVEESGGRKFLVMELVNGETLAEMIRRGAIPVPEALGIAMQITEALEAAHENGIVHRDLKPANIKVTPDGKVKVLDFGLAKAFEEQNSSANLTNSPTMSLAATRQGLILGTAAYMSPEQAKGRLVDRRTDIFAFGAVLFEMLAGRPAFQGEDIGEILARVIEREPDWSLLPPKLPPRIHEVLRRCLEKNPTKRRRDAGDLRFDIEQALATPPPQATTQTRGSRTAWIAAAIATLMAVVFAIPGVRYLLQAPPSTQVVRFNTELGADVRLANSNVNVAGFSMGSSVLLSPDGRTLAFAGNKTLADGNKTQLFVRPFDQLKASPLSGTEGARHAFFSPDGQWIAFFADRKLKKISVAGGAVVTLCEASDDRGGTWADDDSIIFAPNSTSGLMRVSSNGGTPQPWTRLVAPEVTHRWPYAVREGRAVLFVANNSAAGFEDANIVVQSLQTSERKVVQRSGYQPRYLTSGHLAYIHDGTLFAAPFNLAKLDLSAPPTPVLEGVMSSPTVGGSQFAISEAGGLAYLPGGNVNQNYSLVWVDRKGSSQPTPAPAGLYSNPRLSPDGRRVALSVRDGGTTDIWAYDLMHDTLTRLTFDGAANSYPLWTPDGMRVVYRSTKGGGQPNLYWRMADGSGSEERLTTSDILQTPLVVSPDGRTLVYTEQNPKTRYDLLAIPLEGDRKPQMILNTPFDDRIAQFSPDGRWLAYVSDESRRYEVYVQPFPGPGGKQQVSTEGGVEIFWAKSGELFYRTGGNQEKMMAVDIRTQPALVIGKPHLVFEGSYNSNAVAGSLSPNYAVTADGQRFLMLRSTVQAEAAPSQITIVLNWFNELRQKVPNRP